MRLEDCCERCPDHGVWCHENESSCPAHPTPLPDRCGRLDDHTPHDWSRRAQECAGVVVIEGGYEGDVA